MFTSNSTKSNIILLLDDKEYLSEYCKNPITKGIFYGRYFGSSTRIPGGEIWNPKLGYLNIKITIKILQDDNWITIFEERIDSREQLIKTIHSICDDDKERHLERKYSEKELKEILEMNGFEKKEIIEKINELDNLSEFEKISQLEIINDYLIQESFRYIESDKNNQIKMIADEKISPYFVSNIYLQNEKYKINLTLRDLHRFAGEVQISGCTYELI